MFVFIVKLDRLVCLDGLSGCLSCIVGKEQ